MQAYVSLGSRTPAERSTPIFPTRQYRQVGRPNVNNNRLETILTPNTFRSSTANLIHGPSYVTLNDNSSSFFSGATSPMSSVPSQYTPNYTNSQPLIRHRLVPHANPPSRLQCRTQIVRETDPITGELLPPVKVSYTVQAAQQKPISKQFDQAYMEFERVRNELDKRSPLASLR
ncbi:hypothetical protein M3Y97_00791500 [Aphelenchoides bicaudatus]|nr:hypothetical protein M3Y97_00791500 [Aphelenchoides bicaudatus]